MNVVERELSWHDLQSGFKDVASCLSREGQFEDVLEFAGVDWTSVVDSPQENDVLQRELVAFVDDAANPFVTGLVKVSDALKNIRSM